MNVKDIHIKVQVTGEQNVMLQKLLHAKGVAWDTGDPCDGIVNADASYLRLFNGKLYRIWSGSSWHFIQEIDGELYHWHAAMELIEKTEDLNQGLTKDFDKMRTEVNSYICRGWRFVHWYPNEYILMRTEGRPTDMLRVYETGLVKKTDRVTGAYKKV